MANAYIVNKWRIWFRVLDFSHKGDISKADVKNEEEIFAKLSHLDAKKKKDMEYSLDRLYESVIFRGRPGAMNEDEFVEINIKHYAADKAKFQDEMRKAYTEFFTDIVDVNHEGSVSEEEYLNMMRSGGYENTALDKQFFEKYQPVDGKVPLRVIIEAWVQFTSDDDSSKTDIVKEGLESIL